MAEPLCSYFGVCGGCSAQHIDYSMQLENKKKALANAIRCSDIAVFSGREYHYRNRMDMIFHRGGLGLRRKSEWDRVVDIEQCVIAGERLNEMISEIRGFFKDIDYFDLKKCSGTFRYAVIRASAEDSSLSFALNSDSARLAEAVEKIREFSAATTANNVVVTYVPPDTDIDISDDFFVVKGQDMLRDCYLNKTLWFSVQGFFQNNNEVAEKMQIYCNRLLKAHNTKDAHLLDLYGGVGSFGIINAELFRTVTIVESVKQSVDAANKNIIKNKAANAKAALLDARHLKKIELPQPLFVITDPPRTGMHPDTIRQLNGLKPEAIIYVSCNTQQLSKDIQKFKGYKISNAALFDMFPQTPHIEAVIELVKL